MNLEAVSSLLTGMERFRPEPQVYCPWCHAVMSIAEPVKRGGYYYVCPNCDATSPIQDSERGAFYAALKREREPARVLSAAEVNKLAKSVDQTAVYIETCGGAVFPAIIYYDQASDARRLDMTQHYAILSRILLMDYGEHWRAWNKRPTEDERMMAKWQRG